MLRAFGMEALKLMGFGLGFFHELRRGGSLHTSDGSLIGWLDF